MNTMNMPGFTAEASVYKTSGHYRDGWHSQCAGPAALALATIATVNCGTFPDSISCHECNSTGPGTFDCCRLGGMRGSGDSCIILNDPNVGLSPRSPTSGFSRFPTVGLGSSVVQAL